MNAESRQCIFEYSNLDFDIYASNYTKQNALVLASFVDMGSRRTVMGNSIYFISWMKKLPMF